MLQRRSRQPGGGNASGFFSARTVASGRDAERIFEDMPSRTTTEQGTAGRPSPGRRLARAGLAALALTAWAGASTAANPGSASASPVAGPASAPQKRAAPAKPVKLVDINGASRAELMRLPGIGDAEAARIVAGRPYLSKADLATKNVLPTGVYLSLKDRIVAIQKQKTKAPSR
jgi:DNA uptake protein ComE-like DNA-binding protein